MKYLRFAINGALFLIYSVFVTMVLYFPAAELIHRIGRETRLIAFYSPYPVGQVLLPGLALAVLYAALRAVQRKIDPIDRADVESGSAREDAR